MSGQQAITLGGIIAALFLLDVFVLGWVLVDDPMLQQISEIIGLIVPPAIH